MSYSVDLRSHLSHLLHSTRSICENLRDKGKLSRKEWRRYEKLASYIKSQLPSCLEIGRDHSVREIRSALSENLDKISASLDALRPQNISIQKVQAQEKKISHHERRVEELSRRIGELEVIEKNHPTLVFVLCKKRELEEELARHKAGLWLARQKLG